MTEQECLAKMISPGKLRPSFRGGIVQIHITRACNEACWHCTQGAQLAGKTHFMSPEHFEQAVRSLGFPCRQAQGHIYFGVVGLFGGNPALSPHFEAYCRILKGLVPYAQRGLWCNHPCGKGKLMRETFKSARPALRGKGNAIG